MQNFGRIAADLTNFKVVAADNESIVGYVDSMSSLDLVLRQYVNRTGPHFIKFHNNYADFGNRGL